MFDRLHSINVLISVQEKMHSAWFSRQEYNAIKLSFLFDVCIQSNYGM